MPYLMVSHTVASYAKWKRAVNAFAPFRKASGEQCLFVSRNSKNPNDLLVWCEWDTTARMKKFATSPELRAAMKDAGVTSKPVISFYSKLENLSAA